MRPLYSVLCSICLLLSTTSKSQVFINEYSCTNLKEFVDDHNDFEDWIEFYNDGTSTFDLSGYYLSDDPYNPTKWAFPAGTAISGKGFLRIWCSGRDKSSASGIHTNFKLVQTKNLGEHILLSDEQGQLIESVNITVHQYPHSVGRKPDGGTWGIFIAPTPGSSNNNTTQYTRYAATPVVSVGAGYYPGKQKVSLTTTESNATIRYTLDGKYPSSTSTAYTTAITMDSVVVLKAVTFSSASDVLPSQVEVNTYFINVTHTMPIVSISGKDVKTLAQGSKALKPFGTFEYFDMNGKRTAVTSGEFNSHGQDSWKNDQRSLDFVSRDEMGINYAIQEQLFTRTPRKEFQRVIMRAAGDDNYPANHDAQNEGSAHMRDAYVQNLAFDAGCNLDVRKATKVIIYLDGIYWGIYDLRELPDDHDYCQYYYNQGKFDLQYVLTWGSTWAEYGGNQALADWKSTRDFIVGNDMSIQSNFDSAASMLDVYSLVDYLVVNSLVVTSDWLNYNTGVWRGLNPNGGHKKWGYILWDNDAVFGFYINYTGIPDTGAKANPCNIESGSLSDPEQHLQMLKSLRKNKDFDAYYISRYIDLCNGGFSQQNMLAVLDSTINVLKPEMTKHAKRWSGTYKEWYSNAMRLRSYIKRRTDYLPSGMTSCYNLKGPVSKVFQVTPKGSGFMQINSVQINQFPYKANFYNHVDVKLTATPYRGWQFSTWNIKRDTLLNKKTSRNMTLRIAKNDTIYAVFKQATQNWKITISEINYNNDLTLNPGTWLELVNYGTSDIDLTGWSLFAGTLWKQYDFAAGATIKAGERWLLVSDTARFRSVYGQIGVPVIRMPFNLSQLDREVILVDSIGTPFLQIPIQGKDPWPLAANGAGRTMELIADSLDASLPENWRNGCIGGSPGRAFTSCNEWIHVGEINYHASPLSNDGDWVEWVNNGNQSLDLSGMLLRDQSDFIRYTFPANTSLGAGERLVLATDSAAFNTFHSGVANVLYAPGLNLSNSSDFLRLYTADNHIVFSVAYTDGGTFSSKADGDGYTLEFNGTYDDLSAGRSWSARCWGGTPGDALGSCEGPVIVSEIQSKSAPFFDGGDWIELQNLNGSSIDVSGWVIGDSLGGSYKLPAGTTIPANGRLLVISDTARFFSSYSSFTGSWTGPSSLNFSSKGDDIYLYNAASVLRFHMQYGDSLPWPYGSNAGWGYTLELADTAANLNKASAWMRGCLGGSPGVAFAACEYPISITEFNYNGLSNYSPGDWVEITNTSAHSVDLSGWVFSDANPKDVFSLPASTLLGAGERLVLVADSNRFRTIYGQIPRILGNFNFGLGNSNDQLRLFDAQHHLQVGVAYNTDSTWDALANGQGFTLNLDHDTLNLSQSRLWKSACMGGSPGEETGPCTTSLSITEWNVASHYGLSAGDWVELYNPGQLPVSLDGVIITNADSTLRYALPANGMIMPKGYIIVPQDSALFAKFYPGIVSTGSSGVSWNANNDKIFIYDRYGNKIESATTGANWPAGALGQGRTLERIDLNTAISSPSGWQEGCIGGSPGQPFAPCYSDLVISEINYNASSTFNTGTWLEIQNRGKQPLDVSGYSLQFTYAGFNFTIPANTVMSPGQKLVLASKPALLQQEFPTLSTLGTLANNLTKEDVILLNDKSGRLFERVFYSFQSPWPAAPNGNGYTLEFIDTAWRSDVISSWFSGCYGGSPGSNYAPCPVQLNLSEINFASHSRANVGDWLELFNTDNHTLDISGYSLSQTASGLISYIPAGTLVGRNQRLVWVQDSASFTKQFGTNMPVIFNLPDLALTDTLVLRDGNGTIILWWAYDGASTHSSAHATGYTIAWDEQNDMHQTGSWHTGCPLGSPGTTDLPCTGSANITEINPNGDNIIPAGDWLEMRVTGNKPVPSHAITVYRYDSSAWVIPNGPDLLFPGDYAILANDTAAFLNYYGQVAPVSNLPWTIDNGGDGFKLSVYGESQPNVVSWIGGWPESVMGTGKSLEYVNGDPSLATSWNDGCLNGSPGNAGSACQWPLVISEINYASSAVYQSGDWLELHNRTSQPMALVGYSLKTNAGDVSLPTITLNAGEYVVFAFDSARWNQTHPGLGAHYVSGTLAENDFLKLYDALGHLVIQIHYDANGNWPSLANGQGNTLELMELFSDPTERPNWFAGCFGGSPGTVFSQPCTLTGISAMNSVLPVIYPVPTTGASWLLWPGSGEVYNVQVWQTNGSVLYRNNAQRGTLLTLPSEEWSAGIYFISLRMADGTQQVFKLIKE